MRTSWGSATDRGRVRHVNEDALLAYPPVFLVADGMGGHAAGDVASRIAVEEFGRLAGQQVTGPDDLQVCFQRVARRLRETVVGVSSGTTVAGVATTVRDGLDYWLVFNVGDSRVYRWSQDRLVQVSVDHSVVQELVDRGEIDQATAAVHPERHVLTRAVGTSGTVAPDYWMLPVGASDRMLLCSDGLTGELSAAEIAAVLAQPGDAQEVATVLVRRAVAAGGRDNVTAVVVDAVPARLRADLAETVSRALPSPAPALAGMLEGSTVPCAGEDP